MEPDEARGGLKSVSIYYLDDSLKMKELGMDIDELPYLSETGEKMWFVSDGHPVYVDLTEDEPTPTIIHDFNATSFKPMMPSVSKKDGKKAWFINDTGDLYEFSVDSLNHPRKLYSGVAWLSVSKDGNVYFLADKKFGGVYYIGTLDYDNHAYHYIDENSYSLYEIDSSGNPKLQELENVVGTFHTIFGDYFITKKENEDFGTLFKKDGKHYEILVENVSLDSVVPIGIRTGFFHNM